MYSTIFVFRVNTTGKYDANRYFSFTFKSSYRLKDFWQRKREEIFYDGICAMKGSNN